MSFQDEALPPSTSLPEGSPASPSVKLEADGGMMIPGGYGLSSLDSFANYDPASSSWRTWQISLTSGNLAKFSQTFPQAGSMRNGLLFRRAPWVPHTHENDCFLWHTPTVEDKKPAGPVEMAMVTLWLAGHRIRNTYIRLRSLVAAREGRRGPLNPPWVEWLMGYPIGWTDLEDSATP